MEGGGEKREGGGEKVFKCISKYLITHYTIDSTTCMYSRCLHYEVAPDLLYGAFSPRLFSLVPPPPRPSTCPEARSE